MFKLFIIFLLTVTLSHNLYASLKKDELKNFLSQEMKLGKKDLNLPIWEVLNKDGKLQAYTFETYDLAPVLGFSGGKMNMLVTIDLDGNFLDVNLLDQDEPVFVSGLGVVPFLEFLEQYKQKNLSSNIKVGKQITVSNTVYIDGVSKATASVKIANDSILASSIKVASQKLSGVAPKQIRNAKKDLFEKLTFKELLEKRLITNIKIKKGDIEKLFKDSGFENNSFKENKDDVFLDLYIANLAIPSIMNNLLQLETQEEIKNQITQTQEPIIIFANGEHQILSENFVPNTSPDTFEIIQDTFPIHINDGDYEIQFLDNIPNFNQAIILDVDKKYNFDPSSSWLFNLKFLRGDTTLYSTPILKSIDFEIKTPNRYFETLEKKEEQALWLSSMIEQKNKLIILSIFLTVLFITLYKYQTLLEKLRYKRTFILLITLFFIGWYGQGQLSMVTILGFVKAILNSQSLNFLLYDPFSLIIWFFVFISLIIWGRGTFCGWLCPYGVLQELSYYFARLLRLPIIKVPQKLSDKMTYIRYIVLVLLILSVIFAPKITEYLIEIEPFKTSITLIFDREIPYVLYALFWIFLSMFIFKGFCRFICPLGAFLSLAGKLKFLDWLPRRKECGNPCNNCYKNCNYNAIDKKDGHIKYDECFQCLDCVQIYSDDKLCKILIKNAKDKKITSWRKTND
ncbi:MAG: 4Fe-4S binding protein [Poseidonibacter sp.]|uniref:4Fe-4S binding protein n=1 Tax=Poseidonibacter sp. TaxID=2321188 RepID=UPI00359EF198